MLEYKSKKGDVKNMTNKIRYTYRPPKELFEAIVKESNRKEMAINSVITTVLWNHYFENKKGD